MLERVSADKLGSFRPSILSDAEKLLLRRRIATTATRAETLEIEVWLLQFSSIYVVPSCDIDNDGVVTDEERASCV